VTDQWAQFSVEGANARRVLQTIVYPRSVASKFPKIRIVATEDARWDIAIDFLLSQRCGIWRATRKYPRMSMKKLISRI
jgi:hypothetical protein